MAKRSAAKAVQAQLRRKALAYPEAFEDFPWGEAVYKVRGKIFLFLGVDADGLGVSVKLPDTNGIALMLPGVEPTGHGLGRSGWVSAAFAPDDEPSMRMLEAWVDESYRAVAPRKLVKRLDAPSDAGPSPGRRPPRRRARK